MTSPRRLCLRGHALAGSSFGVVVRYAAEHASLVARSRAQVDS